MGVCYQLFGICFQTEYHGKRRKGAAGKAGEICVILLLMLNIWMADWYTRYSSYTFLIDLLGLFLYSEWFLEGTWIGKLFSIFLFYVGLFSCNFICMAAFRVLFSVPVGGVGDTGITMARLVSGDNEGSSFLVRNPCFA